MKIVSISGIVNYIKDAEATASFYEAIGFVITEKTPDKVSIRLNWFWIDFHVDGKVTYPEFPEESQRQPRGGGQYLYVKVDKADDFHRSLVAKGLKPLTKPRDWPWGNREFVIHDPDGYKLVFFEKL